MFYKILLCAFLFAGISTVASAQAVDLSIDNKKCPDCTVSLLLEYADGHYQEPSIPIALNKSGKANRRIPLKYPLFVLLKIKGQEQKMLLSPGRDLQLIFTGTEPSYHIEFKGNAAPENELLRSIELDSVPFYIKEDWQTNPYARMPLDSLQSELLPKIALDKARKETLIQKAVVPKFIKKIFLSELHYVEQCYLHDFARNYMRWANNPASDSFTDQVMASYPLPDSTLLSNGLYANMMLGYQQALAVSNIAKTIKTDRLAAQKAISQKLGESFEMIDSLVRKYGERYIISWLYARTNLPVNMQDKVLFNKVMDAYNDGFIQSARYLFDTLKTRFPNSNYLAVAQTEIEKIDGRIGKNINNQAIHFYPSKKPESLEELVASYKGKVVYLDFWGTWCGPCRIEMQHVAELKKHFENKNVVFVYLDMDDDEKEATWINYVRLYGIEGEHYRLNKKQINSCWEAVKKAGGETNRYPTYILFDQKGKIVSADAERPSSREKLYQQIEELF